MKPCIYHRQSLRAFTMIEVLLAAAILALVITAIYSSWVAILRSSKVGLTAAADAQRTRVALRAIEEAFSSAQLFGANLRYYSFFADTSGDYATLSFVARLPASFPGSGMFGDQSLRRVTFLVEPDGRGKNQLHLQQTPLLEAPEATVKPYTIVLAPNVNLFALEFLDTNKFEWVPEWPYTNRLPKMARVAVSFGEKRPGPVRPEDMTLQTVLLSAVAIPREVQLPGGRFGAPIPAIAPGRVGPGVTPIQQPNTGIAPGGNAIQPARSGLIFPGRSGRQ